MKVKMLEDRRGAVHGIVVREYHKGTVYEIADPELAQAFIADRSAENVEEEPPPAKPTPIAKARPGRKRARRKAARARDTEEK
jgi:hypothetical protein